MPSSYQPPVSGNPHDPFEKYRIEGIQKDKGAQDSAEGSDHQFYKPRSAFTAYVSLLLKKFIDFFESTTEQGLSISAENDVLEHIKLFKTTLEALQTNDLSQDPAYLNRLSICWHQLLEDSLRFRRKTELSIKIRDFIMEFQHHPEKAQHTLGYYLTEFAGQKWLPFPYMELIGRLHQQCKNNPAQSQLNRWIDELSAIIQMLTVHTQTT